VADLACALLFWSALAVSGGSGVLDMALVNAACAAGILLWAAFMIADEATIKYAMEQPHELLFVAQLATLGLMHLPRRFDASARRAARCHVSPSPPFPPDAGVFSTMTGMSAPRAARAQVRHRDPAAADVQSCLVDAYTIDTTDALFEAHRPKVEEEREELKKLRDAGARQALREAAAADTELRARAQAFNARVAMLNSQVAYAQEARDRFSRTCKGRRYYFEDLTVVRDRLPVEVREAIPKPQ
jgi:hypothetical protein